DDSIEAETLSPCPLGKGFEALVDRACPGRHEQVPLHRLRICVTDTLPPAVSPRRTRLNLITGWALPRREPSGSTEYGEAISGTIARPTPRESLNIHGVGPAGIEPTT